MATDTSSQRASVLALVTAAIAFLDSDGAFGPADPRTVGAKARLRAAVDDLVVSAPDGDPLPLRVIQGALAGDR
jgi:hypothetical protein